MRMMTLGLRFSSANEGCGTSANRARSRQGRDMERTSSVAQSGRPGTGAPGLADHPRCEHAAVILLLPARAGLHRRLALLLLLVVAPLAVVAELGDVELLVGDERAARHPLVDDLDGGLQPAHRAGVARRPEVAGPEAE